MNPDWRSLAQAQDGIVARRQLTALDFGWDRMDSQVAAERWTALTPRVVATFTGTPTWEQRVWAAVLHAGGTALVGGLSAMEWHGLSNWHREDVTVLVEDELIFEPVAGVRFFRTRRDLVRMRHPRGELPLCRAEPAALLFAAYDRSSRTGQGLLAAAVQQGLTTATDLLDELARLMPLRRSRLFRTALDDIGGGAQSLAQLDVARICHRFGVPTPRRQTPRRDGAGIKRFTDCEWELADGTLLVLEVDGGFHMEAEHWEDDISTASAQWPRSSHRAVHREELRDDPEQVVADLRALGLSGLSA